MSMRVDKECEGCLHCTYETWDEYGVFSPGYYCDLDKCYQIDYSEDSE